MKVLWIIPGKDEGSSFVFSRRQVIKLKELGVEGEIYFLQSRTNPFSLHTARKDVKNILNTLKPDIVHAHYGSINGFFTMSLGHPKTIVTFHGSDLNATSSNTIRNFLTKRASAYCYRNNACNIVVSDLLKDKIPSKYHAKTFVIPIGVDENLFKPMPQLEARKLLGWNSEEKVIIFNGNNPKVKRLDIALKVLEIVKKQFVNTRLEVLSGDVAPERIPLLLNASDVLLLCSDTEGSPMIVKEAMACSLPIVSNIVGDTEQRLANVMGAKLSNQNPENLAENIIHIFNTPSRDSFNLREQFIGQNLSESYLSKEVIKVYQKVLQP